MENLKSQIKFIQEIEIEETVKSAEEQAKKIVNEAKEKAEKIKNRKMREVSEKIHERESAELAITRLEGRQKIVSIKSQLFEQALARSMEKIAETVDSGKPLYTENLGRLIIEASTKLNEAEFEILTNSRDRKFIEKNLSELEKKISISKGESVNLQVGKETLKSLGGAIVQTKDKRQIFNNTVEARFTMVKQEMAGKIFEILFEGTES